MIVETYALGLLFGTFSCEHLQRKVVGHVERCSQAEIKRRKKEECEDGGSIINQLSARCTLYGRLRIIALSGQQQRSLYRYLAMSPASTLMATGGGRYLLMVRYIRYMYSVLFEPYTTKLLVTCGYLLCTSTNVVDPRPKAKPVTPHCCIVTLHFE